MSTVIEVIDLHHESPLESRTDNLPAQPSPSRSARIDPRVAPIGAKFPHWTDQQLDALADQPAHTHLVPMFPVGARFPRRTVAERAELRPAAITMSQSARYPLGARFARRTTVNVGD